MMTIPHVHVSVLEDTRLVRPGSRMMVFSGDNGPVLIINMETRTIEIPDGVSVSDAARTMLDILRPMLEGL